MAELTVPERVLKDAARLLEMEKWTQSPVFRRRADDLYLRLRGAVRGRGRMTQLPFKIAGETLDFSAFQIKSKDLSRIFAHCQSCVFMSVTLGPEVDRLLARVQKEDMADAVLLDALASSEVELMCDRSEQSVAEKLKDGQYMTMRYSPGYGDVPLEVSAYILSLLGVRGDTGISMTDSFMLVPVKSVTAMIGISDRPEPRARSCADCYAAENCVYRKRGAFCGVQN